MYERKRIVQYKAIYFLIAFFFVFLAILILFAGYFSPVKEIAPDKNQERQQTLAKGVTDKDLSFDQLPSLDSVSESSPTTDFLYTKEYQLSRLEGQYKLAELDSVLAKLGEEFSLVQPVGKVEGDFTLVTFRSNNYELTYSLTKGLVGVGYKDSAKLDLLVPKLFRGKQVTELESKGYTKIDTTKTGYHYFAHPKFQFN